MASWDDESPEEMDGESSDFEEETDSEEDF